MRALSSAHATSPLGAWLPVLGLSPAYKCPCHAHLQDAAATRDHFMTTAQASSAQLHTRMAPVWPPKMLTASNFSSATEPTRMTASLGKSFCTGTALPSHAPPMPAVDHWQTTTQRYYQRLPEEARSVPGAEVLYSSDR